MVKQGDFSVELVYADSKTPFPEHTASDGSTYVEVEPDAEYFIRIHSDRKSSVLSELSVDGSPLQYWATLTREYTHDDFGLWSFKDGKSSFQALRFVKAGVRNDGHASASWTGTIEVKFHEAIFEKYYEQEDYSANWSGGDISFVTGLSDPDKKKGVKSGKGSSIQVEKASGRTMQFHSKGALIGTVKLHYCSILGLVKAGILPKPPRFDWDHLRRQYPRESAGSPTAAQEFPEPEMKKNKLTVCGIEQEVNAWTFDLTNY